SATPALRFETHQQLDQGSHHRYEVEPQWYRRAPYVRHAGTRRVQATSPDRRGPQRRRIFLTKRSADSFRPRQGTEGGPAGNPLAERPSRFDQERKAKPVDLRKRRRRNHAHRGILQAAEKVMKYEQNQTPAVPLSDRFLP